MQARPRTTSAFALAAAAFLAATAGASATDYGLRLDGDRAASTRPASPPLADSDSGVASLDGQPQGRERVPGSRPSAPAANEPRFIRPKRDNPTRDGSITRSGRNIFAAWFSGTTNRYSHSPFDTDKHPDTLTVSLASNRIVRFTLPPDSVFEDRNPRIADVDGDGQDEIVVVRTYLKKGSAVAVIGVKDGKLAIVAETPAIGAPQHWLNPAGIADFDGDGSPDIAVVVDPDTVGELQIWSMRDGAFERILETSDVSNHAPQSRFQGLSAVADFNGDGIDDLAIASQDRRSLRFFSFAAGKLTDLGAARLQAPVAEDFQVVDVSGNLAVRVGFAGGRTQIVVPCKAIDEWVTARGGECR